jgi:hypothetical protein
MAGDRSIWRWSHLPIGFEGGDGGGGVVEDYFWGTLSLAVLVVLVGLLIAMVAEDIQRAMEQRRH